jgi:hypothetical protein
MGYGAPIRLKSEEYAAGPSHIRSLLLRGCAAITIGFFGLLAWMVLCGTWSDIISALPGGCFLMFLLPAAVLVFGLVLVMRATYLLLRL